MQVDPGDMPDEQDRGPYGCLAMFLWLVVASIVLAAIIVIVVVT